MILIISTCADKLSELEFVLPLTRLVGNCAVKHYSELTNSDVTSAKKIIISGTALKDFDYLKHDWSWLKDYDKPVLGICAGMQVIAQAHSIALQDSVAIGPQEATIVRENKLASGKFNAYFLHTRTGIGNFEVLATNHGKPCMIKHPKKEIYGCIFHPEVMNEEIIQKFITKQ